MITSKEELIRKLAALPDEIERKYEKEIMTLAMIGQKTDFDKWAKSVMELPDDAPCTDVKNCWKRQVLAMKKISTAGWMN